MTKFGQAEFADFITETFVKNRLEKLLAENEKTSLNSRNAEDIYRNFPSAKDAAQEDEMLGFIIGMFIGGNIGVFAMCLCTAASDADKCMDSTDSDK